jgi:hypothetical protein
MFRPIRWAPILLWAASLLAGAPGAAEEPVRPRLDPVRADARGHDVFLTFRLKGALNPELAAKIEAGLETAIRYEIRLYRHEAHWLWDNLIDRRRYRVAVLYDAVTREYVLVETMDGRPLQRSTTRDFAEASRRLLSADNLLVFHVGDDKPRTNLYLELRATFDSGYLFTIIPVDSRTDWAKSNRFEIKKSP